jgi:hypothetical protein
MLCERFRGIVAGVAERQSGCRDGDSAEPIGAVQCAVWSAVPRTVARHGQDVASGRMQTRERYKHGRDFANGDRAELDADAELSWVTSIVRQCRGSMQVRGTGMDVRNPESNRKWSRRAGVSAVSPVRPARTESTERDERGGPQESRRGRAVGTASDRASSGRTPCVLRAPMALVAAHASLVGPGRAWSGQVRQATPRGA